MNWKRFFHRRRSDAELQTELDFYVSEEIAENVARGMSPGEARRQAHIKLGNPRIIRERLWQQNTITLTADIWRDLKFAVRSLKRTPGFTTIAVLVLALGTGLNIALFTVVWSVLLKPLPFDDPDHLVMLYERSTVSDDPFGAVAGGIYGEWKKNNGTFSNLAVTRSNPLALSGAGGQLPEQLETAEFSWNMLSTLGVHPALGRDFAEMDDRGSAGGTALLSWSLWKRRFGADSAVINHIIYLNAAPYTVIGVMPQWFAFPDQKTELWTPLFHEEPERVMGMYDSHFLTVVGRLKPGFTKEQAVADLTLISKRVHDAHLDDPYISNSASARPLLEHMVGKIKTPLYVLLAATLCVLLIACLNVANLLVARAAARRRDLAIRTALGGSRFRLLRERMTESLCISALGGVLGLLLAFAVLRLLATTQIPLARIESIHIDGAVATFTACVILLCGLFPGLMTVIGTNEARFLGVLQETSRSVSGGSTRVAMRKMLLGLEVGLTAVLLLGAGLLFKSYEKLRSTDIGCITKNVLTLQIRLPGARYYVPASRANFFDSLLDHIRALPGVEAAGYVDTPAGQGAGDDSSFWIVEHPSLPQGSGLAAMNRWADSKYFAAMGIPILRGRTFNPGLRLDQAREIIISDAFAKAYFHGEEPLGKHIRTIGSVFTIVGIVGDTRYSIGEQPGPVKYFSMEMGAWGGTLVIRSDHDVEQLALPIQRVIGTLDRDLPVSDVFTMDQLLGLSTLDQSLDAALLLVFAVLALVLASVGLFGVLSYVVSQKTNEIGVRIALGAQRRQVLGLVLFDGMKPALIGLVCGMAASVACARLFYHYAGSLLYETSVLDLATFIGVAITLLLVATLACAFPAWRASRLNPTELLRAQ